MKTALSILGSLMLGATSCVAAEQAPYTLAFAEYPPFSMTENGKPKGVAVAIVSKMFEKAKLPFKLQSVPLARAMDEAKNQDKTCVFAVQRAQDIEAEFQWVSPILITRSGLFMHPDATASLVTLSDAKKLKIGALRGSGDAEYLKRFGFAVEEASTQDQNLQKLMSKRFDIWASDVLSVRYYSEQAASKDKAPKEMLSFRTSLGSLACNIKTPKTDLAKLQASLDGMIKDGSMEKLTSGKL